MRLLAMLQIIGGVVLVVSYLPQLKQIWKTRSTQDINILFPVAVVIGVGLMEPYAISVAKTAWAYTVTNSVSVFFAASLLISILWIRGGKNERLH